MPVADASFHPVQGGGVLFDASQGRLYALNAAAGFVWLCIRDGFSKRRTTRAVADAFDVDEAVAAEWCRTSFEIFHDRGLLETGRRRSGSDRADEPTSAPAAGGEERRSRAGENSPSDMAEYRLFGTSIRITAPAHLRREIDSLLGGLRAETTQRHANRESGIAIDIAAHGDEWQITIGGRVESRCPRQDVVAEVERLLVQTVVPETPHLLTFHAAIAQRDGRSFLLAGRSGAGKTTLCVGLAHSGWVFGSDELVLLTDQADLLALPFPACIKADAYPVVEAWFPRLRRAREHNRYGKAVKYLTLDCMLETPGSGYVIFPNFAPASKPQLRPLNNFVGLERLLEHCVFVAQGFAHNDVSGLLEWHSRQQYFDLDFGSCDAAIALLKNIVAAGEGQ